MKRRRSWPVARTPTRSRNLLGDRARRITWRAWALRAVGDDLWHRFTGGKEGTLWYYRTLVEAYKAAGTNPTVEELERVVREIEALARCSEAEERRGRGTGLK